VSDVTDLIRSYKAGHLTLDELVQKFLARRWPVPPRPNGPSTYLELAARAQEDPGSDVPGSFDDVEAAFFRHEISLNEYTILRAAMSRSAQPEKHSGE
jgi:hypothetical protein